MAVTVAVTVVSLLVLVGPRVSILVKYTDRPSSGKPCTKFSLNCVPFIPCFLRFMFKLACSTKFNTQLEHGDPEVWTKLPEGSQRFFSATDDRKDIGIISMRSSIRSSAQ